MLLLTLTQVCLTGVSQSNGIFELRIKNDAGKEEVWTIDLKKTGTVYRGPAKPKSDVAILLADDTFLQLADGKVSYAIDTHRCFAHLRPPSLTARKLT